MMKHIYSTILPFVFFLLFSLYWAASNDHSKKFVECLLKNSDNSTAMSKIIYTRTNPSYTGILTMYVRNLRYGTPRTPKPQVVLTPIKESQIQAAIYCSKKVGLQMRIRSGGNDLEGSSYVSHVPFFVLDMFGFRSIHVDAKTSTVWAGAGATLGELYFALNQVSRTQTFPGGYWPTDGLGGFLCNGGYGGGLVRKHGVGADNVIDARIIIASGKILDKKSMGKDLFWAIRGGNCANFGVVTAFKLKLVPIPKSVAVFVAPRSLEQNATSLVYKWQFVAPHLPRELYIAIAVANVLLPNSIDQTVVATFVGTYIGDCQSVITLMAREFPELGVTQKDCVMLGWTDSILYNVALPLEIADQILVNRTPPVPSPFLKMKADFVEHPIPKKGINNIFNWLMHAPAGVASMEWIPFGGRMNEISESSIPFPHRKEVLFLVGQRTSWYNSTPVITEERVSFARKLGKIIGRYVANNPRRGYVNYRDHDLGTNNEHGPASVEHARKTWGGSYFKGNFDRLVKIKSKVDPKNYFKFEQSIPVIPLHS